MSGPASAAAGIPAAQRRRSDRARLEYRRSREVACSAEQAFVPLRRLGGPPGFYFANLVWSLRARLDAVLGGPGAARRRADEPLSVGGRLGMFEVARVSPPRELLLRGRMKVPGGAWLRFEVADLPGGRARLSLNATLEAGSWLGRVYWAALYLPHAVLFRGLLRGLARAALSAEAAMAAAPPITAVREAYRPDPGGKISPCMVGCPSGTDIRGWITTVAQRRTLGLGDAEAFERAWRTITEVNPFPAVTGRVCPHPCEAGCNRRDGDGAVSVREMERFLGDWAIGRGLTLSRLEQDRKPETIGVVGAGPAGLSFAYQLARRGYRVTVYERQEAAGGMLRFGIPPYRLPAEVVEAEVGRILGLGVELVTGVRIGDGVSMSALRRRHDVVFLGIGASAGRPLGIPGEDGPGVLSATDYLESARRGASPVIGDRVLVIGGGDVAMDAARTARRQGAAVTVLYRRTRDEMPAAAEEIDEAQLEGVRFEFLAAPVEILRARGVPRAVVVRRMRLGPPDASGRPCPLPVHGSEVSFPATAVLCAVARDPRWDGLETGPGRGALGSSADGRVADDLWIGGDVLAPGIVTAAIAQGRRAAEALHASLRGLAPPGGAPREPVRVGSVKPQDYAARSRSVAATRDAATWLEEPEAEIHRGIGEAQFLAEAERCLSCGHCFGCERCFMYCPHGCYSRLDEVRPGAYFALDLERCHACGKCVDLCPCGHLGPVAPAARPPS